MKIVSPYQLLLLNITDAICINTKEEDTRFICRLRRGEGGDHCVTNGVVTALKYLLWMVSSDDNSLLTGIRILGYLSLSARCPELNPEE